ncbi:MAG: ATP-dependent RNA helicase ddx18 [Paramarteilia canceri]
MALHGNLTQSKRSEIFSTFKSYNCLKEKQTICLLCTDVAARGLDVPDVDWVLHYDLPQNSDTYIHRIGRCARDMCSDQFGQSLLVFNPWETSFIDILKNKKIDLREIIFENDELPNIDEKYFELVQSNTELKTLAQSALKGYIKTYLSRQDKQVFDPTKLKISEICQNFGFQSSPSNDLEVQFNRSIKKLKKKSLKLARKTKYKYI